MSINKSVFYFLRQLTINAALRTFAAARRAEARLLLAAGPPPSSNRSISLSRRAHSSKPATAVCGGRVGQTDGPVAALCRHTGRSLQVTMSARQVSRVSGRSVYVMNNHRILSEYSSSNVQNKNGRNGLAQSSELLKILLIFFHLIM